MMRSILIILMFLSNFANGQFIDTIYYRLDDVVSSKDSAFSVRYIRYDSLSRRFKCKEWSLIEISHGSMIQEGELLSIDPEIKDGEFKRIDEFGNYVTYLYANDKFVDIVEYKNDEGKSIEPIYLNGMVDSPADYKQGMTVFYSQLLQHLKVRNELNRAVSNTRLYFRFIIEKDGSTSNISILKGGDKDLDSQIVDYINKSVFKPAKHRGSNVKISMILPIQIGLD